MVSHWVHEQSEAQRGWLTCPRVHSSKWLSQEADPGFFQPSDLDRVAESLKRHSLALTHPCTALMRQEAGGEGPAQGHGAICTPSTAPGAISLLATPLLPQFWCECSRMSGGG